MRSWRDRPLTSEQRLLTRPSGCVGSHAAAAWAAMEYPSLPCAGIQFADGCAAQPPHRCRAAVGNPAVVPKVADRMRSGELLGRRRTRSIPCNYSRDGAVCPRTARIEAVYVWLGVRASLREIVSGCELGGVPIRQTLRWPSCLSKSPVFQLSGSARHARTYDYSPN
jgi:hypothetical protein